MSTKMNISAPGCDNVAHVWYALIGASGSAYIFGLVMILIVRYTCKLNGFQKVFHSNKINIWSNIKWKCELLLSSDTLCGKILIILNFLFNLMSVTIYIFMTINYFAWNNGATYCEPWTYDIALIIDAVLHIYFLLYFLCEIVQVNNVLGFWLSSKTIVNVLTICSHIVMVIMNSQVIAFRYLRFMNLILLTNILVYFKVLRSRQKIKMSKLILRLCVTWLTSAGVIHILENNGDAWNGNLNSIHLMNFGTSIYFILISMATIGYGDIYPETVLGKAFIVFFVLYALGMFASIIPEIIENMDTDLKYSGCFYTTCGQGHVIVTGHLSQENIKNFLHDFLHPERKKFNRNLKIVFLGELVPDLKLKSILKTHELYVFYFTGRITRLFDRERVHVSSSDAVFILSDSKADDTDSVDCASIMQVVAIKDATPNVPVIVQLQQFENKARLLAIPGWNKNIGDVAVCHSEFQLGIIAQSIFAPGFSTLLSNLIALDKPSISPEKYPDPESWQQNYLRGGEWELYATSMSEDFHGITFTEAVEICFVRLNIMLLAIQVVKQEEEKVTIINPGQHVIIDSSTMKALALAENEFGITRIAKYCSTCHSSVFDSTNQSIQGCNCQKSISKKMPVCHCNGYNQNLDEREKSIYNKIIMATTCIHDGPQDALYDITGLYHWQPYRDIDAAIIKDARTFDLQDHVVIGIVADVHSPQLGLSNLLLSLRSSVWKQSEIVPVVLLGDLKFITTEWSGIQNFPEVYILPGSPLNAGDLRKANIPTCKYCVLFSHLSRDIQEGDPTMLDKEVLLATLNIKALPCLTHTPALSTQVEPDLIGNGNRLLVELRHSDNFQFLDDDDDPTITQSYMSQPFVTGRMFNANMLHSLVPMAYFNPPVLEFLQGLVTGGATNAVEQILSEGHGLPPGGQSMVDNLGRCRLEYHSVERPPLQNIFQSKMNLTFMDLFLGALKEHGIICLGLFRILDTDPSNNNRRRFVCTFPSKTLVISPSDMVYCFSPIPIDKKMKLQREDTESLNVGDVAVTRI